MAGSCALDAIDIGFDTATASASLPEFSRDKNILSGLPVRQIAVGAYSAGQIIGSHNLMVYHSGALAPDNPAVGDSSCIDGNKLRDILLILEYGAV